MNKSEKENILAEQARAESSGLVCVVGALVQDSQGRIYVHRRSKDRHIFPLTWDVIGGHVDAGETLFESLQREVLEESGWRVKDVARLVKVWDWETIENGQPVRRREFDFIVTVDGDLAQPRLEKGKHDKFRWIGPNDLDILLENREPGDTGMRPAVAAVFEK